jgi:hypothetical protein
VLHFAEEVIQCLAGERFEALFKAAVFADAVEPEIAEVVAQFAPGCN